MCDAPPRLACSLPPLIARPLTPPQMICLERLDGRAFSLPLNVVPSIDMSRKIASNVVAVTAFLGPYLLTIVNQMSGEVLCPVQS